jgi:TRAP-type C4-dicarboxylate transport system substrate-binding protein
MQQAAPRLVMLHRIFQFTFAALLLLPEWAAADPIELKLSFFTSDRSSIYQCQVKPFVDAVNAEGKGLIEITVYFSGAISPVLDRQDDLVATDTADLAQVTTSYSPDRFSDTAVMELPGLFRNEFDASRVFTRLSRAGGLAGYGDFLVLNAFVSAGENIHSRKPIVRLDDLKGQRIRVNNDIEAETLDTLGAIAVKLPLNRTMDALGAGSLDGATVPPSILFEFGFGRLTSHHYLIHLGGVPTVLLMNRNKFASLPARAQEIVLKHSGEQASQEVATCFAAKDQEVLAQLRADPRRQVVDPSPADLVASQRVFDKVREYWAALSAHNREVLTRVQSEIAALPAAER